jgi:hypothetical protein
MRDSMMRYDFVKATTILLLAVLPACQSQPKKNAGNDLPPAQKPAYKKPPATRTDTLVIRGWSAVFFSADTFQLEKLKSSLPKMEFESNKHDCYYQSRNAKNVLRTYWPTVSVLETTSRYLLFIRNDSSRLSIDLDTKNEICGNFLFDGQKDPLLVDMTNIDTELGFYFQKEKLKQ